MIRKKRTRQPRLSRFILDGRDRISELPVEILDKILGYLPIEEAARTSVLSTTWRNIWFSLTYLNFDFRFFFYIWKKYHNSYNDLLSPSLYVINKVLLQHSGPIRKFVFELDNFSTHAKSRSWLFEFDQWLLFATRNGVEEINIGFQSDPHRLPDCMFSCITLKRLHLVGVTFGPINAPCILPNVTSLSFESVDFGSTYLQDCAAKVPMLENLSFMLCTHTFYCNITAPKLCSFSITCCEGHDYEVDAFLPVYLDLRSVRTIELNCSLEDFVKEVRARGPQPPVLNVEYLKLSLIFFPDDGARSALIDLLQICPELCKLDMQFWYNDGDNILKFLEKLPSVAQTHKMFHTLKLERFEGKWSEMLFIKGILACFPSLEKVIIVRPKEIAYYYNEIEIVQKLLRFHCASPKAEIVYI